MTGYGRFQCDGDDGGSQRAAIDPKNRVPPRWGDLVLPQKPMTQLRVLAAHAGGTALFLGGDGAVRLEAAGALADALGRDLYRIGPAVLASRYIGETEKNLARLLALATRKNAILLFDEADALFGRRAGVLDAHDRYANLEVSHLLQKISGFRGLAILSANRKPILAPAVARKFSQIVRFPASVC